MVASSIIRQALIREALVISEEEHYPVHVGCRGECILDNNEWFCYGCDTVISNEDIAIGWNEEDV